MRASTGALTAFFLSGLFVAGCEQDAQSANNAVAVTPASNADTTSDQVPDQIADQRALPYAGGSEIGDEPDGVDLNSFKPDRMQPGYTLYSIHLKSMARLIDERGKVVKEWRDPAGRHWDNIELLENGDLITTGADPAPVQGIKDEARYAMRLSWDGRIIWKKYLFAHHDMTRTPNGELMLLTFQRRKEPSVHRKVDLRDDMITRLTMDGELIDSLSMYDTLTRKPKLFPLEKNQPTTMGGRQWVDTFHCNSVEPMHHEGLFEKDPLYGPDNVLFCSRHQNRIAILDFRTKELLWAWGRQKLDGPHDATMLENGHILVFDNGLVRGYSRIVELDPLTRTIVWQYFDEQDKQKAVQFKNNPARRNDASDRVFYSKSKGSNQRLANGNTLICNSDAGEIFEVTSDRELVWRYLAPERVNRRGKKLRAAYVRAYRYERAFIDRLLAQDAP